MDILARRALLYDFYGPALSERQRRAYQLHYLEDLSLAECGEELGCSRPAALTLVRRAERQLEELDAAIGAIAEHDRFVGVLRDLRTLLDAGDVAAAQGRLNNEIKEFSADV